MSVIVMGIEMPNTCYECNFCQHYVEPNQGYYCVALFADLHRTEINNERNENCPLVEVPPHGDLIDRDTLKVVQQADADFFKGSSDYGEKCRYDEAINAVANIVNAPTIIPAEEGE